jgi:hypothetical protein
VTTLLHLYRGVPSAPTITPYPPFPWKAGYTGRLECLSTDSPPPWYTWRRDGEPMTERSNEVTFPRPSKADHNANIVCEAHNRFTDLKGNPVKSLTTQLDIECKRQLLNCIVIVSSCLHMFISHCSSIVYMPINHVFIYQTFILRIC